MFKNFSILIVEPEEPLKSLLFNILDTRTHASLFHANNMKDAMEILHSKKIELMITDLFLPDKSGLKLIEEGCGKNPGLVAATIMPLGSREHIIESLQAGVNFRINTPYDHQEIIEVIKNALQYQKLLFSSLDHTPRLRKSDGFEGIIGKSDPIKQIFDIIKNVTAQENGNVLLKGESGTGKELAARAIHNLTEKRSRNNFVPVNCAAIPDDLLESELFGYEKGAFTGAAKSKKGRLEHADKGTLFLDEIGDMKPSMQAKLLRVVQEQAFEPVGSIKTTQIDIRIIAATNRNLLKAVKDGSFREDLFYRLNVIPITIPPLRDRIDDIEPLIESFLLMFNRGRQIPIKGYTASAIEALKAYHWPGNVRELQNIVQRICILHSGDVAGIEALPKKFQTLLKTEPAPDDVPINTVTPDKLIDFNTMTCEFENRLILQALNNTNWNKKEAARLLNIKRTTLLEKIKKRKLTAS